MARCDAKSTRVSPRLRRGRIQGQAITGLRLCPIIRFFFAMPKAVLLRAALAETTSSDLIDSGQADKDALVMSVIIDVRCATAVVADIEKQDMARS